MEETKDSQKSTKDPVAAATESKNPGADKIKTRSGSGYLKQLYSTARTTAGSTHSGLKGLTTFLVNFIPTEKVDASEMQMRVHFDDSEIAALAHSIKEHGVLQPILVVQDGDRYKVVAGERRLRASKLAGIDRIPARVLSTNDKATHEIALRENLDRVDLHPIEEGEGYLSLLEQQVYTSHDSLAKAFGKPKSRITECIGFTRLPEETKIELMSRGIKNRSLLRQMLLLAPEQHKAMIEQVADKEEILGGVEPVLPSAPGAAAAEAPAKADKKEAKGFVYSVDAKAIVVPAFKWKAGDKREKLQSYAEALKKLLEAVEDRLTMPESK